MYRDSYEFKSWTVGKIEYVSTIPELAERIEYLTDMIKAIELEKEFIEYIRQQRILKMHNS